MKKLSGKFYFSLVIALCLSQLLYAQRVQTRLVPATLKPPAPPALGQAPNGITVGRPKVFDNRTLTLMLEALSESLRKIQFVDQQKLAAAFGLLQGYQTMEIARSLSIGTRPTPKITDTQTVNTGNVSTAGAALPDTTKSEIKTERESEKATPPDIGTLPAFQGFTPNFGENASDLLSDQVNLTYQIFNLRMLLERSLSDRLLGDDARRQAVMGFNVTIDPPRTAEDAVAVVEVTLKLPTGKSGELSLVSMMPEEKTYNAAALSTKSNAFGGAAVAKMINIGYSEQRRGQTFYLYRDADTIAYQRMNEGKTDEVIFGWMFRPVLGRRSVSPGLRQLFAIMALPSDDNRNNTTSESLNASVRTYWKKYDQDTKTSFEERDANRATRFRYAVSLNLTKPEIFNPRYENRAEYSNIVVESTRNYEDALIPRVNSVSWRPIGGKSIIISATGDNFFSETKVAMGDKIYSMPADGLILKSNQAFDLTTTIDALANGSGTIIGRYGSSVPLIANRDIGPTEGLKFYAPTEVSLSRSGFRQILFHITAKGTIRNQAGTDIGVNLLSRQYLSTVFDLDEVPTPIITVNGKVVSPSDIAIVDRGDYYKDIACNVPESYFGGDGVVLKVSYPFLPTPFTISELYTNPEKDFVISRFSKHGILIRSLTFFGFNDYLEPERKPFCWNLFIGGKLYPLNNGDLCTGHGGTTMITSTAISVDLSKDSIEIPDKIVLISPDKAVFNLEVAKSAPSETPAPKPIEVGLNDRVIIEIPVDNAAVVERVEADGIALQIIPLKTGDSKEPVKKLKVRVDTRVTGKPGKVDLSVFTKEDKIPKIVTIQITCKTCRNKGE
jgi:hypothetical protein